MMKPALLAVLACCATAPAVPYELVAGEVTWQFDQARPELRAVVDGETALTLRQFGPRVKHSRYDAVDGEPGHFNATSTHGPWELVVSLADNGLSLDFRGEKVSTDKVEGGVLDYEGVARVLDLSQYQFAHGQTSWPQTYYLSKPDLFVCLWWDPEVSTGSGYAGSVSEQRESHLIPGWPADPWLMLTSVLYRNGLETGHLVRERLNIRASRRLWDAALPALAEPSEFRDELAQMAFLDLWGSHTTAELQHLFGSLERLVGPHVRLLTVLQNWQAGGFDALLPDSIWLPDYPPNPAVGTVDELRRVAAMGNRLGRFAFRTNYAFCRDNAPSVRRGLTARAVDGAGQAKWHTRPATWPALVQRQEAELARLWQPTASFTDQLTSGGSSQAYLDYSGEGEASETIAGALRHQRAMAEAIKAVVPGPLGSETLNQQDLIGRFVDYGDFGFMGGHDRRPPVDYKLRRMHALTMFFGCGLTYRFFELPPFKQYHAGALRIWDDPSGMDDYRCAEIAFGNGAYVCWPAPVDWLLTELIVVGRAQREYALQPVDSVEYLHDGRLQSLEELVRAGQIVEARPWKQQQGLFDRIAVRFANGVRIVANRSTEDWPVELPSGPLVLPPTGWAVFAEGGGFVASSGFLPGTTTRVDSLDEGEAGLRFLNPRGAVVGGSNRLRLWRGDTLLWEVDAASGIAWQDGERFPILLPEPAPLTTIDWTTPSAIRNLRPTAGILRVDGSEVGLRLAIASADPQLVSPPLHLVGQAGDRLRLTMSADAGEVGQLYFATTADPGISERQVLRYKVVPDGAVRKYELAVGEHPRWAGQTITRLRLDPIHGPEQATVVLGAVQLTQTP